MPPRSWLRTVSGLSARPAAKASTRWRGSAAQASLSAWARVVAMEKPPKMPAVDSALSHSPTVTRLSGTPSRSDATVASRV